MVRTTTVPIGDSSAERDFIELPFSLYEGCPHWVPPFRRDVRQVLRREHPFFEHADGEFYLVKRNAGTVARIGVFENHAYNEYHQTRHANLYFFDSVDDPEAAEAAFQAVFEWARGRGLDAIHGPVFSGGASASGVLIEGFDQRSAMTMMPYNYPYYRRLYEAAGFEKRLDLLSARLDPKSFELPERVRRIARMVLKRGKLSVKEFRTKRELKKYVDGITALYDETLARNSENYPLTERELREVARSMLFVADPKLIKILMHGDRVVGFLFAFPDLSAALQRSNGKLTPASMLDIMLEFKRTDQLIINGAGIHPEYQKMGGNALLYYELERTAGNKAYDHADLTQVAETTELMLRDLQNLGASIYKRHRVFIKSL